MPPAIGQQHQLLQESDVMLCIPTMPGVPWGDPMAPKEEGLERIALGFHWWDQTALHRLSNHRLLCTSKKIPPKQKRKRAELNLNRSLARLRCMRV